MDFLPEYFWGRVHGRPLEEAGAVVLHIVGEAEVDQFAVELAVNHDVLRFDVIVAEAQVV